MVLFYRPELNPTAIWQSSSWRRAVPALLEPFGRNDRTRRCGGQRRTRVLLSLHSPMNLGNVNRGGLS